ncbi:MAG: hypothetical protein HKN33_15145 [Pyrinomonadaceae bacterium]|nr:hypothetical protein [Pyrinomonadaceae bacterium]
MRKTFVQGVGGVLSADIAVPDHERELAFYSKILTTGDDPLWRDDLMNNLGMPIIGLGARTPEYDDLPLQWMPHIQVADVAASAAFAINIGGKELMHGKDEDGQSQWAVLLDPNGAAFGIVPVVAADSDSADKSERVGCVAWLSLAVPDASSSMEFYRQVVGWDAGSIDTGENEEYAARFEMQIDNEIAAAEICQLRSDENVIPPVWLIHLPVDDLAESLQRVGESGGKVVKEFTEARSAIVRDPVGVYLALQAG